jgi:hypothetical protein
MQTPEKGEWNLVDPRQLIKAALIFGGLPRDRRLAGLPRAKDTVLARPSPKD